MDCWTSIRKGCARLHEQVLLWPPHGEHSRERSQGQAQTLRGSGCDFRTPAYAACAYRVATGSGGGGGGGGGTGPWHSSGFVTSQAAEGSPLGLGVCDEYATVVS